MSTVVDDSHRCFPELLQLFLQTISIYGHRYPEILEAGAGTGPLSHLEPDRLDIWAGGPMVLRLLHAQEILRFLQTGENQPTSVEFNELVAPSGAPPPPGQGGFGPVAPRIIPSLYTMLLGYAWEREQVHVRNALGSTVADWPADCQFFTHVRNGCFHGGTFNIWEGRIRPPTFPRW